MSETEASSTQAAPRRSPLQRYWFDIPLWKRILPALLLGAVAGMAYGPEAAQVKWLGDIFVRLTRMVVAPLVFVTIMAGVMALGDPKRLGALGLRTVGLFVGTAAIAVCIGVSLGLLLQPGVGVSLAAAVPQEIKPGRSLSEQLLAIIPLNPVQALVEGDMLAIIFFAVLFAAALLKLGERAKPLVDAINVASDAMLTVVKFVIETAPFGVFGLVATAVGVNGLGVFVNVSLLALGTLVCCTIQTLVVQPGLIRLAGALPAAPFLRGAADAILVAFSTSSSSASLPVEMTVAEKNLGLHKSIISTVLPVGVSIGRDGTALYVALLSVFAAQALGVALQPVDVALIIGAATLLAVSTPPVPSSSLFMMAAVLSVVGIDDAQSALIVGFILPFDRPLDMIRTVPNVMSNLTNATLVARWSGEMDPDVLRKPPRV
jgi:Na+/H+-dicarboxylate symporters